MNEAEQNVTKFDKLAPLDVAILTELLKRPSATDLEISQIVGVSRPAVTRRRNSDPIQAKLQELIASPLKLVNSLVSKAIVNLDQLLGHEDPRIQLAAISLASKYLELKLSQKMPDFSGQREIKISTYWGSTEEETQRKLD